MRFLILIMLLVATGLAGPGALGETPIPLPNTTCPVDTAEPAEADIAVQYEGKTVHFCCKRCRRKFLEDPTDYLANFPQFAAHEQDMTPQHEHDNHHHSAHAGSDSDKPPSDSREASHDHAGDHGGDGISLVSQTARFAGKFHPLFVHFPIALILAGFLAEVLTFLHSVAAWRVVLAASAIAIGIAGDLRATLIYGADYFTW